MEFIRVLQDSCEESRVSAVFAAGVGGSAPGRSHKEPHKTDPCRPRGQGINHYRRRETFHFSRRRHQLPCGRGTDPIWQYLSSPTPSFVLPMEYTMTMETFKEIGGHIEAVRPVEEVLGEIADTAPPPKTDARRNRSGKPCDYGGKRRRKILFRAGKS